MSEDREIEAIKELLAAVEGLSFPQKRRALAYVIKRVESESQVAASGLAGALIGRVPAYAKQQSNVHQHDKRFEESDD